MKRRLWLQLGVGSAALLAALGVGVTITTPRAWGETHRLSAAAREVCAAIARGVIDQRLPAEPAALALALDAYLIRLEAVISAMPHAVQSEISEVLTALSTAPGRIALTGLMSPWSSASVSAIQASLSSMRESSLSLRMQAYHALRDLTHAAWYADEATWGDMRYPGPTPV